MAVVRIPMLRIVDWQSFHDVFAEVLGFPDFYGRNMDAWIDCLSDAGMMSIPLAPGEILTLLLEDAKDFASRCRAQYDAIIECSAFVNWRCVDPGGSPVVALAFWK